MTRTTGAHAQEDARPPTPWWTQFKRAFVFVRPDRVLTAVVLVLTLSGAAIGAVEPLVLMRVFDGLVDGSGLRAVGVSVAMLLGLGLVREGLSAAANWLMWRVRLRVHYRLLEATVDRLHSLPVEYHREQSVGSTMTRLERGIQGYLGALTEFAFGIVPSVAYLALAIVLMVNLDWRLSLLVLGFAPLPAIIGAWAAGEQTRRERVLLDRWSAIYSRFNEVLAGIVTVKSFAMEDAEKKRFLGGVSEANVVVDRGVARDSSVGAVKNLVALAARVAAIGLGGFLVVKGEVTIGVLVAFLGYVGSLFGPVQGLTGTYQTMRRASVALDTIFSILDAQDKLGDAPDAIDVTRVNGEVDFVGVTFGYQSGRSTLEDVDLHVRPGEVVALVGPSGAGKSTLMALLQRLYDPTRGEIRVDGVDIRRLKQRSLRRHVGVVLQDALLFNDSVRDAVSYARPDATQDEVEAAARAANAHDFIMRLPQGYDTVVGERGSKLSGGERQRLAIARALLKDPAVLILDEATSALDAESEAIVQEALARLIRGRTTFIIAHRLSTVVNADRIVVLRDGRVEEVGTHRQLLAAGGYYASLVHHQTRGLLEHPEDAAPRTLVPTAPPPATAIVRMTPLDSPRPPPAPPG